MLIVKRNKNDNKSSRGLNMLGPQVLQSLGDAYGHARLPRDKSLTSSRAVCCEEVTKKLVRWNLGRLSRQIATVMTVRAVYGS